MVRPASPEIPSCTTRDVGGERGRGDTQVRELTHDGPGPSLVLAGAAAALAVVVAVYGRWRTARISHAPLPSPLAPHRAVPLLGGAVALLALVTGVVLSLR